MGAGSFEGEGVAFDAVDEEPVGREVAFAVVVPAAEKVVGAMPWRKRSCLGVEGGLSL